MMPMYDKPRINGTDFNKQSKTTDESVSENCMVRLRWLEQRLLDPRSDCYLESLLDVVINIVEDTRHLANIKSNKHFNAIFKKFEAAAQEIQSNRLRYSDFDVIKVIGEGAFGQVQLVRHSISGRVMAMKVLDKKQMIDQWTSAFFWEEREIMANANSEWIVQLFFAFQDTAHLYMCMEFMAGGNLVNWMDSVDDVTEDEARFYVAEVVLALEVLHDMGFVHRDVKPDNMLLDARGHLKLADFGTCIRMEGNTGLVRTDTAVGTPDYISPEVLLSQNSSGAYGAEVDWWALGVFLYELLYAETPFYSESLVNTYSKIMNHTNTLNFPLDIPVTDVTIDFMKCLLTDREARLGRHGGASEVQGHVFFDQNVWTWSNIRSQTPPFQPQLSGDTDTSNFGGLDGSSNSGSSKNPGSDGGDGGSGGSAGKPRRVKCPDVRGGSALSGNGGPGIMKPLTGENLAFAGFTFSTKEYSLFSHTTHHHSPDRNGAPSPSPPAPIHRDQERSSSMDLAAVEEMNKRLTITITGLEAQLEEALADCDVQTKEIDQLHTKLMEIERTSRRLELERDSAEEEARISGDQLKSRCDQVKAENGRLLGDKSKMEADIHKLQAQLREEMKARESAVKSEQDVTQRCSQLTHETLRLTESVTSLEKRLMSVEEAREALEKSSRVGEVELAALRERCGRLGAECDELRKAQGGRDLQVDSRVQEERSAKEAVESRLVESEQRYSALELDMGGLKRRLTTALEEVTQLRSAEKARESRVQGGREGELKEAMRRLGRAEEEAREGRERLEAEQYFSGLYKAQLDEKEDQLDEKMSLVDRLNREVKALQLRLETSHRETEESQEKERSTADELRRMQKQLAERIRKESKMDEVHQRECMRLTHLEGLLCDQRGEASKLRDSLAQAQREAESERAKCRAAVTKINEIMTGDTADATLMRQGQKGRHSKVSHELYKQLDRKYKKLEADMARLENKYKTETRELREQYNEVRIQLSESELEQSRLKEDLQARNEELSELVHLRDPSPHPTSTSTPQHSHGGHQAIQDSPSSSLDSTHSCSGLPPTSGGAALRKLSHSGLPTGRHRESATPPLPSSLGSSSSAYSTMTSSSGGLTPAASIVEGMLEVSGKGRNRAKMNWDARFAKVRGNCLSFFDKDQVTLELALDRILHVRSVNQCDVIHARREDVPRIFQIFYDSSGPTSISPASSDTTILPPDPSSPPPNSFQMTLARKFSLISSFNSTDPPPPPSLEASGAISTSVSSLTSQQAPAAISCQGHTFHRMHFRTPTICEICHRTCSHLMRPPESLQCIQCQMKLHAEHLTSHRHKLQPCNKATRIHLFRAASQAERDRWLGLLDTLASGVRSKNLLALPSSRSSTLPPRASLGIQGRAMTLPPTTPTKDS